MRYLPLLAVLALAVAGCRNGEDRFYGNWSGPARVVLTLKKDHTVGQTSDTVISTGAWKFEGGKVIVSIDHVGGKPFEKALAATDSKLSQTQIASIAQRAKHIELTPQDDKTLVGKALIGNETITFTKM